MTQKIIYEARSGSRITKREAKRYGPEIYRLIQQEGESLTPETVLSAARDPRSPLHSYFEWDNRRAANVHRINQARYLLRSIVIIPVIRSKPQPPVRAFFNVKVPEPMERKTAYVSVQRVGRDPALRDQVIAQALREAQSWWQRYSRYHELQLIGAAIEKVAVKLTPLKKSGSLKKVA